MPEILTPSGEENVLPGFGQLVGLRVKIGKIDLCSAEFRVGRSVECDLVLNVNHLTNNALRCISKIHFTLLKNLTDLSSPTYIINNSSNGTCVSGKRIGKNERMILMHEAVITIGSCARAFVYHEFHYVVPIQVKEEELLKNYRIGQLLGTGAFGTVYFMHHCVSCKAFALKIVNKLWQEHNQDETNEVNILKNISHPCVIKLYDVYFKPDSVYMVLEYMQGGDLLTRILDTDYLPEELAKFFFFQLCHAIKYLHSQNIIHRDLKPDNILLKDNSEYPLLKVSDFGTSKLLNRNVFMRTICGTPHYVAPEVLERQYRSWYTKAVDIWSLGVVLYTMLSGLLPFAQEDGSVSEEQIMCGDFSLSQSVWASVGQTAKDLVYDILNVDPMFRPTINNLLESSWFRDSDEVNQAQSLMALE
ncbi:ovarian-specific serine/threonine-protein kinase Lok-like [Anopheles nili]|uniref:ovarian-specific serine/threonine-protein kinase Lok-like n=1 Tax=Anopheles nili TaxID=185578 RepID=UPI00237B2107|nr:ovarian-specific serine/threonine-protein kinase Lok-like [Anopheles nili]